MALTKKAADKKYDELRKKLKAGEITKERFKQAADRIYKMYHSDANKATRNAKPTIKAKPAVKAKPAKSKTGAAVLEMGGRNVKPVTKPGTHGQYRKKGDPGPAVVKKGSRTGASIDPRERQLSKNRREARRSTTGSNTAGRRNIARQVAEQSGSAKRNQRQVEARRRRARQEGAKRNRRLMLSRKYNKD